jgi:hypothetical protein
VFASVVGNEATEEGGGDETEDDTDEDPSPTHKRVTLIDIAGNYNDILITGPYGDGTSVSDVDTGQTRIIVTGLSDPQNHPIGKVKGLAGDNVVKNVYIDSIDPVTGNHTFKWITKFPAKYKNAEINSVSITKIAKDRFVLLYQISRGKGIADINEYEEKPDLVYKIIDETGKVLKTKTWKNRFFESATVDPVYTGGKIYVATSRTSIKQARPNGDAKQYMAVIDVRKPSSPKLLAPR